MSNTKQSQPPTLPPIAKRQLAWFTGYVRWFLRRNFHGLHLLNCAKLDQIRALPLLVCLNHPSWWDPLIGLYLSQRFFPYRNHAAPIAAAGLAKYKFFERLGFFGIEADKWEGALRFLEIGNAVLSRADGAFWVTPQGTFADVRQPVVLQPGIGHLARKAQGFAMLPVALEYSFWNERYPEVFACFGTPIIGVGHAHTAAGWNAIFTHAITDTVLTLSQKVQLRKADVFEPLLEGSAGVGGVYDLWRASIARLRGKPWQAEHGAD